MGYSFVETAHAVGIIEGATPISVVLANMLSFLLSMAGILAILAVVVSGARYLLASGDAGQAESAKKAVLFSMTGLAVILAALVVVRQITNFF